MSIPDSVNGLPPSVIELTNFLAKFPGVGKKSALRMAMFILRSDREFADDLSKALLSVKDKVSICNSCGTLAETDPCPICLDHNRDHSILCVVEEARDMLAFERSGAWSGLYHILGGAISPLDGIGPDTLRIEELLQRVKNGIVKEIVVATNPTSEGETTALYIARLLKPLGIRVTRIARGVPLGADLEFIDDSTLQQSLTGRVDLGG